MVGGTLALTYVLCPSQMSVPNFKPEDLHQRCSEWLEGWRFRGLEVLDSK